MTVDADSVLARVCEALAAGQSWSSATADVPPIVAAVWRAMAKAGCSPLGALLRDAEDEGRRVRAGATTRARADRIERQRVTRVQREQQRERELQACADRIADDLVDALVSEGGSICDAARRLHRDAKVIRRWTYGRPPVTALDEAVQGALARLDVVARATLRTPG